MIAGSLNPIMLGQIAAGGGSSYLLDDYSGAAAAYSLYKLRSAYGGSCIRVRRSSDNTEQDIGFSGDFLDTSAFASFVGSSNAVVSKWYDQSGNADDLYWFTGDSNSYPVIATAGVIYTESGNEAVYFDGNNDVLRLTTNISSSAYSLFVVAKTHSNTGVGETKFIGGSVGSFAVDFLPQGSGNAQFRIVSVASSTFLQTSNVAVDALQAISAITATSKNKINVNNTNVGSNTTNPSYSQPVNVVGNSGFYSGFGLFGGLCELVLYTSDKDSDSSAITSNQMTRHGL